MEEIRESMKELHKRTSEMYEKFDKLNLSNFELVIKSDYEKGIWKKVFSVYHKRKGTLLEVLVIKENRDGIENLYQNRKNRIDSLLWVRSLRRLKNKK